MLINFPLISLICDIFGLSRSLCVRIDLRSIASNVNFYVALLFYAFNGLINILWAFTVRFSLTLMTLGRRRVDKDMRRGSWLNPHCGISGFPCSCIVPL